MTALFLGMPATGRPALAFEPPPGTFEPGASRYRPPRPQKAPEPREIVRGCNEYYFVDCFRQWQPPEPEAEAEETPPPPRVRPAGLPSQPGSRPERAPDDVDPAMPPEPPPETALPDTPPSLPPGPNPADVATYEALVKAIGELGVKDRVRLGPPPTDDSVDLSIDPGRKPAGKGAVGKVPNSKTP